MAASAGETKVWLWMLLFRSSECDFQVAREPDKSSRFRTPVTETKQAYRRLVKDNVTREWKAETVEMQNNAQIIASQDVPMHPLPADVVSRLQLVSMTPNLQIRGKREFVRAQIVEEMEPRMLVFDPPGGGVDEERPRTTVPTNSSTSSTRFGTGPYDDMPPMEIGVPDLVDV